MRKLEAYTDGSCVPNPGIGGWGWVMYDCGQNSSQNSTRLVISDYGGLKETTNNKMELMALAELLESCPVSKQNKIVCVDIYIDSEYVLGGVIGKNVKEITRVENKPQGYLKSWVSKLATIGTPETRYWNRDVKNGEEWYRIHQSLLKHASHGTVLNFCWVKGHSGVEGNEEADRLSNIYRINLKKQS